jgi:hypothetical protein
VGCCTGRLLLHHQTGRFGAQGLVPGGFPKRRWGSSSTTATADKAQGGSGSKSSRYTVGEQWFDSRQQKKLNTPGQRSRQGRGVHPGRSLPRREEAVSSEFAHRLAASSNLFPACLRKPGEVAALTLTYAVSILALLFRAPGLALA